MKKLICRLFGHRDFEEVYAVKRISFGNHNPEQGRKYDIIYDIRCSRCGRIERRVLRGNASRAELLKEGWFIEKIR